MKKVLLGFLLALWPLNSFGQHFFDLGTRRNSTGTALDSVYLLLTVDDSLMLRALDLDSIRYFRERGTTFVDSTKVAFSADDVGTTGSFIRAGTFRRAFRASDGSGNVGQYTIQVKVYKGSQTSANFEENYVINYMVVTDPQGDVDTADVIPDSISRVGTIYGTRAGALDTNSMSPTLKQMFARHTRIGTGSAAAATTLLLDAGASTTDAYYADQRIYILSGTGVGQDRAIIKYEGALQRVTIDTNWAVNPTGSPVFMIYAASGSPVIQSNYVWNATNNPARTVTDHLNLTEGNLDVPVSSRADSGTVARIAKRVVGGGTQSLNGSDSLTVAQKIVSPHLNSVLGTLDPAEAPSLLEVGDTAAIRGNIVDQKISVVNLGGGVGQIANVRGLDSLRSPAIQAVRKLVFNPSFDNLAPNGDFEADDSTGTSQTPTGWTSTSGSGFLVGNAGTTQPRHGRYCFTPNSSVTRSDSIWMVRGQPYYFGTWVLVDTTDFSVFPNVSIQGANTITLVNNSRIQNKYPTSGGASIRRWVLFDTSFTAAASGLCVINISGDGVVADSFWVDQMMLLPFAAGDTAALARAVWDNDMVAEGNRTGRMHTFKTDTVQARTFPTDTIKTVTDPIAATAVIPDIDNLIRNPHFETGSGDLPVVGWREDNAANNITIATDLFNSGAKALKKKGVCSGVKGDSIYLTSGTNIVLAGRVYTTSLTGVTCGILPVGGSLYYPQISPQSTGKWHSLSATAHIPSSGWYQVNISGPVGASDSSSWDDLSLKVFPDTITGAGGGGGCTVGSQFVDTIAALNTTTSTRIPNVPVLIQNNSGTNLATVLLDGQGKLPVTFDAGTYKLYPGFTNGITWTDNPLTFVVTGAGQVATIRGTTFNPSPPPDPNLCMVFGWISHQGKPLAGATVRFSLVGDTLKVGSWLVVNKDRDTLTTPVGYFELPLLINSLLTPANTRYTMSVIDASGVEVRRIENLVIPNQASFEVNR